MEELLPYFWVVWLVLILLFGVIEMLSLEFTFLMLAVGSLGGLVTGLFGGDLWLQIVIAALLAVALLFFIKPPLLRALHRGADPALTLVDALIGQSGTVALTLTKSGGQVRLENGETWTARLASDDATVIELAPGQQVTVQAIEGATAVVAPKIKES